MPPKTESYIPSSEREDKDMLDELERFYEGKSLTASETQTALEIAHGVYAPESGEVPRPEVYELAEKMSKAMDAGLPVNRLSSFVETNLVSESAPQRFEELVTRLGVSEYEKILLRSILKEKRSGTLVVYDPYTQKVLYLKEVSFDEGTKSEVNELVSSLDTDLSSFADVKIQIRFNPRS
jgi:hypothetical protein